MADEETLEEDQEGDAQEPDPKEEAKPDPYASLTDHEREYIALAKANEGKVSASRMAELAQKGFAGASESPLPKKQPVQREPNPDDDEPVTRGDVGKLRAEIRTDIEIENAASQMGFANDPVMGRSFELLAREVVDGGGTVTQARELFAQRLDAHVQARLTDSARRRAPIAAAVRKQPAKMAANDDVEPVTGGGREEPLSKEKIAERFSDDFANRIIKEYANASVS